MRKRTWISLLIAIAVLAALAVALYLRAKAPPEAARLLPESDAILYINLKPLRAATHFDQTPIKRSPDFQHFIDATGIVPERDLDAVAFALHRMPNPHGPNGHLAYSEVFVGSFDGERLATYLAGIASSQETYAGHIIYTIPIEGRTLRVTQLGYDMVAASNMPTPEQIHSMLDRSRASALGSPGSSLLAARFHDVPLLAQAWGVGHIGLPFAHDGHLSVLGLQLPVAPDSDLVASLRWSTTVPLHGGAAELRIEEFTANADDAERTVYALNALLSIMRGIASAQPPQTPADKAMRQVLDSVTLNHHDAHAVLHATATLDQLKALLSAHDPASAETTPANTPASK
ncbi:MAG TPA: hypothetical protein VHY48_04665 [Acidobacteriaceae bacterium]|jgi:hypothetical protein|nr:hypothetical protein [Acidobacteriaceae bacterium]